MTSFQKDTVKVNREASAEIPSGYMIIQNLKKFTKYSLKDWEQYLAHSSLLSDFLRQEIKERKVLISRPLLYDSYWLIPYQTTKESVFIDGFHNIGQPYYWEEPKWLKNCTESESYKDQTGSYYCMVFPAPLQRERAGIHIKIPDPVQTDFISYPSFIDIHFFGKLIGGPSNAFGDYALWSDIKITLSCNDSQFYYKLPNIGLYHTQKKKDAAEMAKRLFSPLRFRISTEKDSNFLFVRIRTL